MTSRFPSAIVAALALAAAGCQRERSDPVPATALAVEVTAGPPADSAAPAPRASVWLERVSESRAAAPEPPLPEPAPDSAIPEAAPRAPDAALLPPVLLEPAPLLVPPAGRKARGSESVEIEVQVSERGEVTVARYAGGDADSARVAAAIACARGMRFLPARRGERAVAVWCRQRFEFARGGTAGR
jgi:protein TonB